MVQEFIEKKGVTLLPGTGTKELARLNIDRERAYAETARWNAGRRWRKKGTP